MICTNARAQISHIMTVIKSSEIITKKFVKNELQIFFHRSTVHVYNLQIIKILQRCKVMYARQTYLQWNM